MNKNKLIGLAALTLFAMMQISACFFAGVHAEGFLKWFFFFLGGVSCLFGLVLDFLLLMLALDVFGSVFVKMGSSLGKKEEDEDEIEA